MKREYNNICTEEAFAENFMKFIRFSKKGGFGGVVVCNRNGKETLRLHFKKITIK